MNEIIESFQNTLNSDAACELAAQVGDTAIQKIVDEGVFDNVINGVDILSGVPIFGMLTGLYKLTKNFMFLNLMEKMQIFLFNIKGTTEKQREKFIKEYSKKNKEKGMEALFCLLSRLDNRQKAEIVSNLMKARIQEEIDIKAFLRLTNILERIPYSDIEDLQNYEKNFYDESTVDIFLSAGVIYASVIKSDENNLYTLSKMGKLLLKYGKNVDVSLETQRSTQTADLLWKEI